MKAITWPAYGPPEVLKAAQIPTPEPKPNQVKIRIHATTAFPADCEMRRFEMHSPALWLPIRLFFGLFKPRGTKVLGQEFAGVIEQVGEKVSKFKVGDEVFGCTGAEFGAYAEYTCRDENDALAIKPNNVSFAEIVPLATGGANALHYMSTVGVKSGDKILINGAAGCIGSYAVQIAKQLGAYVIATDSEDKLNFLKEIGVDEALDYKTADVMSSGPFDVIFDVVGKLDYPACLKHLKENGKYTTAIPHISQMLTAKNKPVMLNLAEPTADMLEELSNLAADGRIKTYIDKRFALDDAVAAHRYIESGKKCGHVVLDVID